MDPLSRTVTASMGSGTPAWLMWRPSLCRLLTTPRVSHPSSAVPLLPAVGRRSVARSAVAGQGGGGGAGGGVRPGRPGSSAARRGGSSHHHPPDQRPSILVLVEGPHSRC